MFDVKNIQQYYRLGIRKIRKFLLSDKCKESLVFLFFVLVSFAFWMLQTLDDVYQTEFKVPLRLKNVPKEAVLTSELPGDVRVRVEDRGTVLLNYMLGRTFFPISFDFNDYKDRGGACAYFFGRSVEEDFGTIERLYPSAFGTSGYA